MTGNNTQLHSLRLTWPREMMALQVTTALRALATSAGTPLVLEALGISGGVTHRLSAPQARIPVITRELRSTIPGLTIEGTEVPASAADDFGLAIGLRLSTRRRALRSDNAEAVSRSLLGALAAARGDEAVLLRLVLSSRLQPMAVPSSIPALHSESWAKALLSATLHAPGPADAELRTAMRDKQREPGWRVLGQIAVRAATPSRRQQLASGVLGALRQAEAPGLSIAARTTSTRSLSRTSGRGSFSLNVVELSAIAGWPIGDTANLPVARLGSRRLPAAAAVSRSGRVIGQSTWPGEGSSGKPRQLALTAEDSLRHLHLLGPTGTGKSTLLLNLALQDIEAGRGVVVVDAKSDLAADLVAGIPQRRRSDVVVIDPSDNQSVVGINGMAGGREGDESSPELVADQLLEVFHRLYASNWGPRTNDILGASLLTLARVSHGAKDDAERHSLVSVPLLLTNPAFRRRIVGQLHDPVGLSGFWASFEAWSEAERTTAIAPVLNKLRPFLLRPNLRRMLGSASTQFSFSDVFTKQRIVLVDLSKGRIGGEAAQLLGALVLTQLWQAILGRTRLPAGRRTPTNVYLDEFQDYLALPVNLEDALTQARGLGVGFTLAHQHLGQLPPSVRAAVMANARSRVVFQTTGDDARALARDNTLLGAEDFAGLPAFHFYASLMAQGQTQPWCSGRTSPAVQASTDAQRLRQESLQRYGTPSGEIDRRLQQLVEPGSANYSTADDLAPRRRPRSDGQTGGEA